MLVFVLVCKFILVGNKRKKIYICILEKNRGAQHKRCKIPIAVNGGAGCPKLLVVGMCG